MSLLWACIIIRRIIRRLCRHIPLAHTFSGALFPFFFCTFCFAWYATDIHFRFWSHAWFTRPSLIVSSIFYAIFWGHFVPSAFGNEDFFALHACFFQGKSNFHELNSVKTSCILGSLTHFEDVSLFLGDTQVCLAALSYSCQNIVSFNISRNKSWMHRTHFLS